MAALGGGGAEFGEIGRVEEVLELEGAAGDMVVRDFAYEPGAAARQVKDAWAGLCWVWRGGTWGAVGSHGGDERIALAPGGVLVRQRVKRWSSWWRDCSMWFQNRRRAAARARSAAARGLMAARMARKQVARAFITVIYND